MTGNETYPICPTHCGDPNAWKTQLVGGVCGVVALALVVGCVIWVVRFNALQARLKDPQMVLTEEYLQQREEEMEQKKSPWWRFWAKKVSKDAPAEEDTTEVNEAEPQGGKSKGDEEKATEDEDEEKPIPRRLTVLCNGPEANLSEPGAKPHVQTVESMSRVEFVAPHGLRLPHPPNVDPDILSAMKSAMKGKGTL